MSDIFISYATADRERVKPVVSALEQRGWSVWWDRTILPGENWEDVIQSALDEAWCVIVLWSRESTKSSWVRSEADEGMRRRVLIPALLDDVKMPLAFRGIQAANLVAWTGELSHAGFQQLTEAVAKVCPLAAAAAAQARAPSALPPTVLEPAAGTRACAQRRAAGRSHREPSVGRGRPGQTLEARPSFRAPGRRLDRGACLYPDAQQADLIPSTI